jgi:nucleoside-diphosphate-sugar epimerase
MKIEPDFEIVSGVRKLDTGIHNSRQVEIGDLESYTSEKLVKVLAGVDTVIHLAARVHIPLKRSNNNSLAYERANVHATVSLARASVKAGVRRFLFLSSIKVNGENTSVNMAFKPGDICHPSDAYAISKFNAEIELRKIQQESGMEVVVIRPPLVYGPGVKANFLGLLKIINFGIPLPFNGIANKRSFIFIGNLVDVIAKCIDADGVCERELLVSDGLDLSTPELVNLLANAMKKPSRIFLFPYLFLILKIFGKLSVWDRIAGSLRVNDFETRKILSWEPPFSVHQGIQLTVKSFLDAILKNNTKNML